MSARRDQVRTARLRRESHEAAARAARDYLAFQRINADDETILDAWERLETAAAEAAPYWSKRARRSWLEHPEHLPGTLR